MNILYEFFLFFLLYLITNLSGVSAPPFPIEVKQPDGSIIPVRMYGSEYYNFIETLDSYVIEWVEDGNRLGWYYSTLDKNGEFIPSHILVKYPSPPDLEITKHIREISPNIRNFSISNKTVPISQSNLYRFESDNYILKPLVFLVDFQDKDSIYKAEDFHQILFEKNLDPDGIIIPNNFEMSVRDYFSEISNDSIKIAGNINSIIDWTMVDNNYDYYVDGVQGTGGGNGPNGGNNFINSAAALVVEIATKKQDEINYSNFDGDGDFFVDVVILIVEGKGGIGDNYFWPHMTQLPISEEIILTIDPSANVQSNYLTSPDGRYKFSKYIVIHERYFADGSGAFEDNIHPIGTICHEMGHVFGLPDLYDTSPYDKTAAGIGHWGLMGSGNYLNENSPAYMSAWSRYRLGIIKPEILENILDTNLIIYPAQQWDNPPAYILPMDSNMPQEYLIIENRQKIGSDINLAESGLLVWHIDETMTDNYPLSKYINVNPNYYGVNLLQADGMGELYDTDNIYFSLAEYRGDPYPYGANDYINDNSYPSTQLNNYDRDIDGLIDYGDESHVEISSITENHVDSTISCRVSNPNKMGSVYGYDEGGLTLYVASSDWFGIKIRALETASLAGVYLYFPNIDSDVSNYKIKIWEGWANSTPQQLLDIYDGNISWEQDNLKDGGWAFISLLNATLIFYEGEDYYVEINYNGTGHIINFDYSVLYNRLPSNNSFVRSSDHTPCQVFDIGDWNLRVVLSGQNCGIIEDREIWPGNTNGDLLVNEDDIIPLGIYFGSHGCYRFGDAYSWEPQSYPDGWEEEDAALADTNGDGFVNIADVLVILINWGKTTTGVARNNVHGDGLQKSDEKLEQYRNNFYQIYQSLSGTTEPEILIRRKLEELFGFSIIPSGYILGQNYPNPFNSKTMIPYFAVGEGEAEVIIYDIAGRMVNKIVHSNMQKGWTQVVFNADHISSGIYYYRLVSGEEVASQKKMLLLK